MNCCKSVKYFFGTLGILLFISIVFILSFEYLRLCFISQQDFNSVIWLKDPDKRIYMIRDLMNSGKLDKKSYPEVSKMLGSGDGKVSGLNSSPEDCIYWVGRPYWIGVEAEYLLWIKMKKGYVQGYDLIRDEWLYYERP